MIFLRPLIACAALAISLPAAADSGYSVIGLGFEGVLKLDAALGYYPNAAIGNFYDGMAAASGNVGPDVNVRFSSTAIAVQSGDVAGNGEGGFPAVRQVTDEFGNPLSIDGGVGAMFFDTTASVVLNFEPDTAGTFDTGFSFLYATSAGTGSVTLFSGLDGTGTQVGNIKFLASTDGPGCTASLPYCNWKAGTIGFAGQAKSAVFSGLLDQILFDNITFGSTTPVDGFTPSALVPEPSTYGLMALGLLGLAWGVQRRRRPL